MWNELQIRAILNKRAYMYLIPKGYFHCAFVNAITTEFLKRTELQNKSAWPGKQHFFSIALSQMLVSESSGERVLLAHAWKKVSPAPSSQ